MIWSKALIKTSKWTLRWVGIVLLLLCKIVRKNFKFNFKDMQIRSAMDEILTTIEFSCQQISGTTEQTPSADDDDHVIRLKAASATSNAFLIALCQHKVYCVHELFSSFKS